MSENNQTDITTLTVQLLSAFVSNNSVPVENLSELIRTTRTALTEDPAAKPAEAEAPTYTPAVSVRKSLSSPEHILSMIDGRPYKTLKRHLASHGLTPNDYRERYGLPKSYPLVAPNYSEARRAVATKLGLGRKPVVAKKAAAPAASPAPAPVAAAPKAAAAAKPAATAKPAASKTAAPKAAAKPAAPKPAVKVPVEKAPAKTESKAPAAKAAPAKAPAAKADAPRARLSIASPTTDAKDAPKDAPKAAAKPAAKAPAKKKPAAKAADAKPAAVKPADKAPSTPNA